MPRPKPIKGKAEAGGRVVFKRAYWFDRGRSLCELHGWPRTSPGDGLGLVGRYTAAVNAPVGSLDGEQLHLLFTQQCDPHYLVPVALDLLRGGVAGQRELLRCVIRLEAGFWREHPWLAGEVVGIVAGKFAEEDDDLRREVGWFVERWRGG